MKRRKEAEAEERRGVKIFRYGPFLNLQFHLYVLHFRLTGDDEKEKEALAVSFQSRKFHRLPISVNLWLTTQISWT